MPFSFRTYLMIGVVFGLFIYGTAVLLGDDIETWAIQRKVDSAMKNQVIFESLVFEPVRFMMADKTRATGAIIAAIFWPFFLLLLFGVLTAVVALEFIDVGNTITDPASIFWRLPIRAWLSAW